MRLHNFLVDYRNEIVAVTGQYLNSHLAAHLQNISEYDEIAGVFHNDNRGLQVVEVITKGSYSQMVLQGEIRYAII